MSNVKSIAAPASIITLITAAATAATPTVYSDVGTNPDAIADTVDEFRAALGDLNAPAPGFVGSGRRQINWDAAPDFISAPNAFPGDFFNFPAFPRARGVEFTTPGTGFQLSSTQASGTATNFGNINAAYTDTFQTFSPERLFTAIGSNIVEVNFFLPGENTPATTHGFGAVFTGVDIAGSTTLEYFNVLGDSLGKFNVKEGNREDAPLSFFGLSFDDSIIAKVVIESGNTALGGEESSLIDLVVMDDFIFGEPVPAPATLALATSGLLVAGRRRRSYSC